MEQLSNHYVSYEEFKKAMDSETSRVAVGFVRIGFLLNYARETNIIHEGGYNSVNEFAKAEYNIDTTQVSRFVHIYNRFGVPGEPRLQDQYINHGVAKLEIMLTLPDFLNEEITEGYSKREINTLKQEYDKEQKITPMEVKFESDEMQGSVQYSLPQMLTKAVYQLIHDEPALYVRIYNCIELEDMQEIMAPMGENSYIVRVKGIGRLTLFLKNTGVNLINLRDGSKEDYSWQQLFDSFKEYFAMGADAKDSWSNVFQEPWPEEKKEESVKAADKPVEKATKPDKNSVAKPKKESKVKVVEPREETVTESHQLEQDAAGETTTNCSQLEEQLPGQDNIMNHPEYLPDDMKEKEVLTGEVEDVEEPANIDEDNVQQSTEGMKVEHFAPVQETQEEMIANCKKELDNMYDEMGKNIVAESWDKVSSVATSIVWKVKTLKKLMEGEK